MINIQAKGLFNGMVSASLMFAPATHIEPAYAQVLFLYINKKYVKKKLSAEKRAFDFVQSTSVIFFTTCGAGCGHVRHAQD